MNFTELIPNFGKWRAGPGQYYDPSKLLSKECLEEYLSWYYSQMQTVLCDYWDELKKIRVPTEGRKNEK